MICCQCLMSALFVLATGQACTQGQCTASRRRSSSSLNGCGPILHARGVQAGREETDR